MWLGKAAVEFGLEIGLHPIDSASVPFKGEGCGAVVVGGFGRRDCCVVELDDLDSELS